MNLENLRIGSGFDVHAFQEGRKLILGGIEIPHEKGLLGHSDADVLLHAVVDAILGAMGAGDIGQHFPPSDERFRGAPSSEFVRYTRKLVHDAGGRILSIDSTLILEAPKISPHTMAIRRNVCELLDLPFDRFHLKATTTEKLGFTGRKEGIAAQAVCLLLTGHAKTSV